MRRLATDLIDCHFSFDRRVDFAVDILWLWAAQSSRWQHFDRPPLTDLSQVSQQPRDCICRPAVWTTALATSLQLDADCRRSVHYQITISQQNCSSNSPAAAGIHVTSWPRRDVHLAFIHIRMGQDALHTLVRSHSGGIPGHVIPGNSGMTNDRESRAPGKREPGNWSRALHSCVTML